MRELGDRNQYSDWLRAGRPKGRSSSPGRVKNSMGTGGSIPGGKAAGA
jgi:hypothetical protein